MFGYIRPAQGELRVRELERFKACYCGLCHALGKKYGPAARFVLSYELVFLAMLLWGEGESPVINKKRCIASPCRKKRYCARNAALDICASYTVILTWWRLRDDIADEPFIRTIPRRLAALALSRAYRKAAHDVPEFDSRVRCELSALAEYEVREGASLDGAADKFANILRATAPEDAADAVRRPMLELLYHLGRWIYIIDACDDYGQDIGRGRYNPVAARFARGAGAAVPGSATEQGSEAAVPDGARERLVTTLTHSNNLLCAAFELLPENAWAEIVRNIVYLGMPDVMQSTLRIGNTDKNKGNGADK